MHNIINKSIRSPSAKLDNRYALNDELAEIKYNHPISLTIVTNI